MLRIGAVVLFAGLCLLPETLAQEVRPLKFDINAVEKTADPCSDFYQFACGGWTAKNPIPPDQSYWAVFQQMRQLNERRILALLQNASHLTKTRSVSQQKFGDYFASCVDEKAIESMGLESLGTELNRIDAITDARGVASEVGHLHTFGSDPLFQLYADTELEDASRMIAYFDQSSLNLPDIGYYRESSTAMQKARDDYRTHLREVFEMLGESFAAASGSAESVIKIETALATAALTRQERRDRTSWYHQTTVLDLEHMAPHFVWTSYFSSVGFTPTGSINVALPRYMEAIDGLVQSTPIAAWKSYFRWELVRLATPVLPTRFRIANYNFYDRELQGSSEQPSRERQCVALTNRDLGELVGRQYVKVYFSETSKQRVLAMAEKVRAAMRTDFQEATWMEPQTKQEAVRKLNQVRILIGYPAHWRDYSQLEVKRGDALGNALRSQKFEFDRQLAKIGKPVDRGEFYELPQSIEGYHDNPLNVVVFTAGILQPPFWDPQMDDAVNFGLAGAVIGHELSHAFDDQGHRFDGYGNMRNWWTPQDEANYSQKAACFVRQYSSYTAVDEIKVNGQLTLGENIADNGGLRLGWAAFATTNPAEGKKIDGFTESQRFFLAWAQWRCMNVTDQTARNFARNESHAPARWRVNGVVSNMPSFAKAYSCKPADRMVNTHPCKLW